MFVVSSCHTLAQLYEIATATSRSMETVAVLLVETIRYRKQKKVYEDFETHDLR